MEIDWAAFQPELKAAIVNTNPTLVANLVDLSYRLDELEDAHFWACHGRHLGPREGTMKFEKLFAKLLYLKAIASARLGEHPQAVEELCEGLKFVTRERIETEGPGDIRVLKAMKSAICEHESRRLGRCGGKRVWKILEFVYEDGSSESVQGHHTATYVD